MYRYERPRVRIMCDYAAEGYWFENKAARAYPDLPISKALRARLFAWQRWYCRYADYDFAVAPRCYGIEAFSAEGLLIAREVKSELPNWTVIYHDVEKYRYVVRLYWPDRIRPSFCEYPIWNVP